MLRRTKKCLINALALYIATNGQTDINGKCLIQWLSIMYLNLRDYKRENILTLDSNRKPERIEVHFSLKTRTQPYKAINWTRGLQYQLNNCYVRWQRKLWWARTWKTRIPVYLFSRLLQFVKQPWKFCSMAAQKMNELSWTRWRCQVMKKLWNKPLGIWQRFRSSSQTFKPFSGL